MWGKDIRAKVCSTPSPFLFLVQLPISEAFLRNLDGMDRKLICGTPAISPLAHNRGGRLMGLFYFMCC